jgi:hypothetical protein
MIIKTYKCDVCNEAVLDKDVTVIAEFPRRTYKYARDMLGVKLCGFPDIIFEETHFCPACLNKLLNWTKVVDEE